MYMKDKEYEKQRADKYEQIYKDESEFRKRVLEELNIEREEKKKSVERENEMNEKYENKEEERR